MERSDFYGDTDKLLFDILQELKKLNEPKQIKDEIKQSPPKAPSGVVQNKPRKKRAPNKKKEGAK